MSFVTVRPTLFLYIAWQFFLGMLVALITITSIIMLVDFVELSRTLSDYESVGMLDKLFMTILKAPQLMEETIPFVVLFGTMSALYKLNRRSELITMRAAGLSAWRFLLPGIALSGLIGVLWATGLNPLAAKAAQTFNTLEAEYGQAGRSVNQSDLSAISDIWLRDGNDLGQTVIFAKSVDIPTRTLNTVTFYQFSYSAEGDAEFSTRYDAATAQLRDDRYWLLTDVAETTQARGRQPYESLTAPTTINWNQVLDAKGAGSIPPFWELPASIDALKKAGFSATPLIMKYHRLLALPLTLIAMTLVAAGVTMQLTRLGGALRLIIMGTTIGFAVYFANNIIGAFGETGGLPPVLAAWIVPVFVLLCGLARICVIEDG